MIKERHAQCENTRDKARADVAACAHKVSEDLIEGRDELDEQNEQSDQAVFAAASNNTLQMWHSPR